MSSEPILKLVPPMFPSDELPPPPPKAEPVPEVIVSLDAVREDGIQWATECGLKPPFTVNGPEREDFRVQGHGYTMTISEQTGKGRLGTARYTHQGKRSYWSIDGIVTG